MWKKKKFWKSTESRTTHTDTQHHSTNSCILENKRPLCRHNFPRLHCLKGMKIHTHTYTFSQSHCTHSGPWHTLRVIRFSTSRIFATTIYPQRNPEEKGRFGLAQHQLSTSLQTSLFLYLSLLNYADLNSSCSFLKLTRCTMMSDRQRKLIFGSNQSWSGLVNQALNT